ncbi:MAG: asparagine synthase C-terminal domain-containing protein [Nitrosopumilaceae archaeon]
MNKKLDLISIRNILSIRYNPEEKPTFHKKHWTSFQPKNSDLNGKKTEKILKNQIKREFENYEEPIILSLSSGIDSTLSLALLNDVLPDKKIICICGIFKHGFDESKIAKKIAKQFNADFKTVFIDSIFTNMPELISVTNKPKWNTYQHLIAKTAKKFGKKFVTGDGADEIFGGYTFRYNKFLTLSRPEDNWKVKTINYLECHNRDWVPDQESVYSSRINFNWNQIYDYFRSYFSNPLNPLNQLMLADYNGKLLYDFIPSGQMMYKFYKIDHFPLFLKSEVITHGFSLPLNQKYDPKNQKGKLILRKIASRYKIKHIEEKRGFSPNLLFDWNDKGKKICEKYIMTKDSHIYKKKLINYNWVIRAFEKVQNDGDIRYLNRLISILALEIWYRIIMENEMKKDKKL